MEQFQVEKTKVMQTAPRYMSGNTENVTEFGRRYSDLPSDENELDAVIDDLTEDLSGSVHNPQVIRKYNKVRCCCCCC